MIYQVALRRKKGNDEKRVVIGDDENEAFLAAVAQFGRAYPDLYGIVVLGAIAG